jgi:histidine triad (HIT) family protein
VYEDDVTLAFMDIMPLNKGHILVVPREHFGNIVEIGPELYGHLHSVICKLAKAVQAAVEPDGMNIMQLNGRAACQLVPHLHIHLVPRWNEDGLTISSWEPVMGDAAEIAVAADLIKAELARISAVQ